MGKDRNASGSDGLDGGRVFGAAFELDAMDASLFHHGDGGSDGLSGRDLVGAHGKVADLGFENDQLRECGVRRGVGVRKDSR